MRESRSPGQFASSSISDLNGCFFSIKMDASGEHLLGSFGALGSLPFNVERPRRHIAAGHIGLGNFHQCLTRVFQAEILARPPGRRHLAVGDSDVFISLDGAHIFWRVEAVNEENKAFITVSFSAERQYSVLFDLDSGSVVEGELLPADARRLFAPASAETAWAARRHCLDLWDWICGVPFACGEGCSLTVDELPDSGGAWEVTTPHGVFEWRPIGCRNVVRLLPGSLPSAGRFVLSLFVMPPEFEKTQ